MAQRARTRNGSGAPTISEVAEQAGVSRATVSRAFGRPELLLPETVRRVQAVARAIGYEPNRAARALSTGRHGNIALVVPDIANPFFPPLIRAAQAAADAADYCLILGDSNEDPEREDLLAGKLAVQTEGLVLASTRLSVERLRAHAERRPLVLVNRDVGGIPRVLIDTATATISAMEHLVQFGHTRVAYVGGPATSWSNRQRRQAVNQAAKQLRVEAIMIQSRRPTYAAGLASTEMVLASGATAAVTFDDLVAQGLLAGLADRKVEVPSQFSVVGCDDVLAATMHPSLTTVSGRSADAGRVAVDLLVSSLTTGERADVRYVLDSSLVVRNSTGVVPSRTRKG
jgi:LacI family transcriptional regulator